MAQILNPLAAHIRTVKKRLIIVGATILVALMVSFAFSGEMVAWLNRPFPNQLVFYGPTEASPPSRKYPLTGSSWWI